MPLAVNIAGKRFGRLLALRRIRENGKTYWECQCDCGNLKRIALINLGRNTYSCGCLRKDACRERERRKNHPTHGRVLSYYKRNAKLRNVPWNISVEDFTSLISGDCFYCGKPPKKRTLADNEICFNGIDRVDSKRGYEPNNVVSCCDRCNWAKNDMSFEEFFEWIASVWKHWERRCKNV